MRSRFRGFQFLVAGTAFAGGLALVAGPAVPALALTATTSLAMTTTVVAAATVTATPLSFGNYDIVTYPAGTPDNAQSTISVTATQGLSYTIALDNGQHASGSQRRLADGSSNFLRYGLYGTSAGTCQYTTAWDNTKTYTQDSNLTDNYTVCGQVPGGQQAPTGVYTDTVGVTVTF